MRKLRQSDNTNHVQVGFVSKDSALPENKVVAREDREVAIPDLPYPVYLPHFKADIPITFELDQILRDYAQEILTGIVTRNPDRPLKRARERILAWLKKELEGTNPKELHQ